MPLSFKTSSRFCASINTTQLVCDAMGTPKDTLPSVILRMEAGRMLLEGKSPSAVASVLGISPQTAKRYHSLMAEGGPDALTRMSV